MASARRMAEVAAAQLREATLLDELTAAERAMDVALDKKMRGAKGAHLDYAKAKHELRKVKANLADTRRIIRPRSKGAK